MWHNTCKIVFVNSHFNMSVWSLKIVLILYKILGRVTLGRISVQRRIWWWLFVWHCCNNSQNSLCYFNCVDLACEACMLNLFLYDNGLIVLELLNIEPNRQSLSYSFMLLILSWRASYRIGMDQLNFWASFSTFFTVLLLH